MKKILSLLTIVALLCTFTLGCGGDTDDATTPDDPTTVTGEGDAGDGDGDGDGDGHDDSDGHTHDDADTDPAGDDGAAE